MDCAVWFPHLFGIQELQYSSNLLLIGLDVRASLGFLRLVDLQCCMEMYRSIVKCFISYLFQRRHRFFPFAFDKLLVVVEAIDKRYLKRTETLSDSEYGQR